MDFRSTKNCWKLKALVVLALLAQLSLLGLTAPAWAQTVEKDWGMWTPTFNNVHLRGRWWGVFEVNPRINNNIQKFDQLLLRPSLGYRFLNNGYIHNGFCWVSNYNAADRSIANEYRIFQQALFINKYKNFELLNRTRLEERLFDYIDGCAVRGRHLVRLAYTIPKTNWYLVGSNELFVNLNTLQDNLKSGFDQNRVYGAIGRNVSKNTSVEIGYQYQYVNRPDPADDIGRSTIMIQIFNNFL